jgi:putative oxidoreductase
MKNKIQFVLVLLFGLLFINAGLNKFFNYLPVPPNLPEETLKDFGAMKEIIWLLPLLAWSEIIGGLLIIIPKTRALGAIIVFPAMVGILLNHLLVDRSGLIMAVVLMAILGWVIYDNREKYLPMIR